MSVFGYELEFAAPYGIREHIRSNDLLPSGFELGTDISANSCDDDYNNYQGLELRSKKFREGFPANKFKECLRVIKENGGFVHRKCGFHIHFSGFGHDKVPVLRDAANKFYSFKSRDRYCRQAQSFVTRYVPVRDCFDESSPDHYEIRIFNATLSLRGLINYDRFVRKILEN